MNILERIQKRFIRLSRSQRKVAQFVIDNPNLVATHIASEVGKLIGVSESTVIRFCYAMDLSGFNELQEEIKNALTQDEDSENITEVFPKKIDNTINEMMNRDVTSILNTLEMVDPIAFNKTIKCLHESEFIYILGFRQSTPTATYMTSILKNYRKHVKQIQHDMEDIVQQLSNIDSKSLLIIIGVDHLFEDVLTVAKLARNKNAKVVSITNSSLSSLGDYSNAMFAIYQHKQNSLETNTSLCSLIHAMIEGMIAQNKRQYNDFQKTSELIESNFTFSDSSLKTS
ncbi:MurR/RpiR family transcriptional regulator [Ureibacillus acetophenoni]|uniref:RpiR family transcriptional regulator n=1 Tax=Ureibacillus acetophenoni TaxID=614649 RepID=A0A285UKV4_9BACL|nr:MurR/RpiR family transcriptional regulator [Ureibacillus acetophenoni]SOC42018.1 RpiR family transcriptional regulator [Ureibacillus acetophenoni]